MKDKWEAIENIFFIIAATIIILAIGSCLHYDRQATNEYNMRQLELEHENKPPQND